MDITRPVHLVFYAICSFLDCMLIVTAFSVKNKGLEQYYIYWQIPFILGVLCSILTIFGIYLTFFYRKSSE